MQITTLKTTQNILPTNKKTTNFHLIFVLTKAKNTYMRSKNFILHVEAWRRMLQTNKKLILNKSQLQHKKSSLTTKQEVLQHYS